MTRATKVLFGMTEAESLAFLEESMARHMESYFATGDVWEFFIADACRRCIESIKGGHNNESAR